ncbi:MAG: HEAT repeat domain-containing protein [Planctomycetota bacterium]|nr:HEAT repeat domain-containing protein [Planctomycetota bacterium]
MALASLLCLFLLAAAFQGVHALRLRSKVYTALDMMARINAGDDPVSVLGVPGDRVTVVQEFIRPLGVEVLPILVGAAKDERLRYSAFFAIEWLQLQEAFDLMLRLLVEHPDAEVRATLARALGLIRPAHRERSIPLLLRTYRDPELFQPNAFGETLAPHWSSALEELTRGQPWEVELRAHQEYHLQATILIDGQFVPAAPRPPPEPIDWRRSADKWEDLLVQRGILSGEDDLGPIYRPGVRVEEYAPFEHKHRGKPLKIVLEELGWR